MNILPKIFFLLTQTQCQKYDCFYPAKRYGRPCTIELFFYSRDLFNWEDTRTIALETFKKNKPSMMHVAIQGLEIDMKLTK